MQIQGKYRCINCFNELNNENEICNCGYDRAQYKLKTHWLHPGTILDNRYYVGRVIGEGGFGITYIGYDSNLSIKIAIKEFFLSGINSRNSTVSNELDTGLDDQEAMFENYREKFINEARILAKFNDQQEIVTVFNFFKGNNTAYIIMEFLDGETLKEYLKRKKQLSVDEALEIFLPIMETLDKVHATKLIHRDISPDNIIFTKDGKAKLLDFGAAREVADNNKSLSVVLKHGYAPPEQYQTHGNQGPWTDVYALSATIYKCLTGKTPIEAMDRTLGEDLEPVCVITSDCPQIISDVVMKGLEIKWADRYQTMSEMATELKNAWNTENVIVQSHKKDELENTLLVFDDKRPDVIVDESNSSQEDSIFDETLEDQIDLDEIDSDENDFDDTVTIEPTVEDKLPVKSKNIVETPKYQSKSDNKPFIWLVAAIAFCVILGLIITITVNSKNKSAIVDKLIDVSGEKSFSYLIDANVGDIVEFGNYNGYTKWRVLNKDGNKLLLITEEIIDKKAYSTQNRKCGWSTSSLRTWLNSDYYNSAFADKEKNLIVNTTVDGVADKVYLLSIADVKILFTDAQDRIARYYGNNSNWWLCGPVSKTSQYYSGICVDKNGSINNGDAEVHYSNGVRPVINVDISNMLID